ncbi:MAG: hypothetical protein KAX04_05515, partial [Methanomicrobia archaeon]|nr:hypothetical protein [Methanomicrobia archaeon]
MMNKKAQAEVITILLILAISVAAVFAAYNWALPKIEESKDASRIRTMQKIFQEFNRDFEEVLHEGTGSQRIIEFSFEKGNIVIDAEQDMLTFSMDTRVQRVPQEELGLKSKKTDGGIQIILDIGRNIDLKVEGGIPSLYLAPRDHMIVIQNTGGNEITVTRGLALTGVVRKRIVYGIVFYNEDPENNTGPPVYDPNTEMPIAAAAITILDASSGEVVVITKSNSRGEFAAELEIGRKYYIKVKTKNFIMKKYSGDGKYHPVDYYDGAWNYDVPDGGYEVPREGAFGPLPKTHSGENSPNTIEL